MPYRIIQGTPQQLLDQLTPTLVSGPIPSSGLALGGKTLIFTTPNSTVTFSGSANAIRTPAEIRSEVAAVLTTCTVVLRSYQGGPAQTPQFQLVIKLDTQIVFSKDGTANTLLALPTAANTTLDPVAAAKISAAWADSGSSATHYILVAP